MQRHEHSSLADPVQNRHGALRRTGFTIVEVMIALMILSVAMAGLVGHLVNQAHMRTTIATASTAEGIVRGMVERVTSAPWERLGTSQAPWSLPRFRETPTSPAGRAPLTETDLRSLGIIERTSKLENIHVYVEYYRAVNAKDSEGNPIAGQVGVMDYMSANGATDSTDFRSTMLIRPEDWRYGVKSDFVFTGWTHASDTSGIANRVGDNDPIIVRVILTWSDPLLPRDKSRPGELPNEDRSVELFTAKKP